MEVKKLKQALAAVVINVSEEDGSVSAAVRMTVEDERLSETPQVTRIVASLEDVPLQEMFEELLDQFNLRAVADQTKQKPRQRKPTGDKSSKPKRFEDHKEGASDQAAGQSDADSEDEIAGSDSEEEGPSEPLAEEEEAACDDDQEDDEDDQDVETEEEDASEADEEEDEKPDPNPHQINLDDMF
jgi:hypothetical protein